jgi:hypothetical protein
LRWGFFYGIILKIMEKELSHALETLEGAIRRLADWL